MWSKPSQSFWGCRHWWIKSLSLILSPQLFQVHKHAKTFQALWQCWLGALLTPTKRLWEAEKNDGRFRLLICDENQTSVDEGGRGRGKDRLVCLMLGPDIDDFFLKKASSWAHCFWLCLSVGCQLPALTKHKLCNELLSGIRVQKHFMNSHAVLAGAIVSDNEKSLSPWFSCLGPLQWQHFVLSLNLFSLPHNNLCFFLKGTLP